MNDILVPQGFMTFYQPGRGDDEKSSYRPLCVLPDSIQVIAPQGHGNKAAWLYTGNTRKEIDTLRHGGYDGLIDYVRETGGINLVEVNIAIHGSTLKNDAFINTAAINSVRFYANLPFSKMDVYFGGRNQRLTVKGSTRVCVSRLESAFGPAWAASFIREEEGIKDIYNSVYLYYAPNIVSIGEVPVTSLWRRGLWRFAQSISNTALFNSLNKTVFEFKSGQKLTSNMSPVRARQLVSNVREKMTQAPK